MRYETVHKLALGSRPRKPAKLKTKRVITQATPTTSGISCNFVTPSTIVDGA